MQDQRVFLGHRRLIAVETVDHHGLDLILIDAAANPVGKFAGREFGGVDLFDEEVSPALHRFEVDAEALGALEQQPKLLVENEQRGLFTARDGCAGELQREQRFAGAGRTEDQRARPQLDCRRPAARRVRRCRSTSVRSTAVVRIPTATSRGNMSNPPVVMVKS